MAKLLTIFLFSLISQTFGFDFWNDLRVTWGELNQLPMTTADATGKEWVQNSADDCTNGGEFNGYRWINPKDMGLSLLFDVNGHVGGLQVLVAQQDLMTAGSTTQWCHIPMVQNHTINGVTYFTVTAYFARPETLCNPGKPKTPNIGKDGQLLFQIGRGIENLREGYKNRKDSEANGWTCGNCIPGMGGHDFYGVEKYEENECKWFEPTFLSYNMEGQLIGFGFFFTGTTSSPTHEKCTGEKLEAVLGKDNTPQCFLNQKDMTSIHIYFTDPGNIQC